MFLFALSLAHHVAAVLNKDGRLLSPRFVRCALPEKGGKRNETKYIHLQNTEQHWLPVGQTESLSNYNHVALAAAAWLDFFRSHDWPSLYLVFAVFGASSAPPFVRPPLPFSASCSVAVSHHWSQSSLVKTVLTTTPMGEGTLLSAS